MRALKELSRHRRVIRSTVRTSVCACLLCSVVHTQSVFAASWVNKDASSENNKEQFVVVDPGHGTPDPGAVRDELYEKDINLKVAAEVGELLARQGFEVCLTRIADHDFANSEDEKRRRRHRMDLIRRLGVIQHADGDAVISIHCNWSQNPASRGAIVLFQPGNNEGGRLAQHIYKSLREANINASSLPTSRPLYLLKHTEEPCVLVELGFMSNKTEAQMLANSAYQKKLARAIEAGVSSYLRPNSSTSEQSPVPIYRTYVNRIVERLLSAIGFSKQVKHGGVHVCPRPDSD